jgi:hypothetical protein
MVDFNLLRKNQPVTGSLAQQAQQKGQSLAESFISADCIVLVDTSGSMGMSDGMENTRYERACDELKKIQNSMPGKICVISFSDETMFCPAGVPWDYGMGTDLARALKFSKVADVPDMRFIVISDGQPDDPQAAINAASQYKNRIDTIFIGGSSNEGQAFLERLAKASGGIAARDFSAAQLSDTVKGLLSA